MVADDDLLAVVEPLLPATTLDEIRDEIDRAQREALEAVAEEDDDALDTDFDFDEDYDEDARCTCRRPSPRRRRSAPASPGSPPG